VKILFLSRWFPHPPDNGARMRVFHLLKGLARKHRVDLISFVEDPPSSDSCEVLKRFLGEVLTVPYRAFQPGKLTALAGFFSPTPRSLLDTYSRVMADTVFRLAEKERYDLVIASELDMAPYARLVSGARKVLEELEVTKIARRSLDEPHPLRRLRYRLTWWKLSRYLGHLLNEFDGCTVVSEPEREAVMRCAPQLKKMAVIPNGVDLSFYQPADEKEMEPDSLIFTGAVSYRVNFEGLEYFTREIYPLILAERPGARLYVTGKTDPAPLERLNLREKIVFTGYLADLRPMLRRACVNVVPLLTGGGTRLKILEGWAAGTPIVSTSRGAEGLSFEDGRHLLIADLPGQFARAALRIISDPALRASLRENGRALVETHYGWNTIVERLDDFLVEISSGESLRR
jgi:glycosyltransferase involved in cell wall biosynthesis